MKKTIEKILRIWYSFWLQPIGKRIGIVLLVPPIISILAFIITFFTAYNPLSNFEYAYQWTGQANEGGYSSALPNYFGLMAIAGVYLIRNSFRNDMLLKRLFELEKKLAEKEVDSLGDAELDSKKRQDMGLDLAM